MLSSGPPAVSAARLLQGGVSSVDTLRGRWLNYLTAATVVGIIAQAYFSNSASGVLVALASVTALIIVLWHFHRGRMRNAHLWIFSIINVISVVWALTNPERVTLMLATPLAALGVAMLWLPRRQMAALTLVTPALMAIIHLVGHRAALARGDLTDALYQTAILFITGLVVAQLIRQFALWLVDLNEQTEKDIVQLRAAREALEQRVDERTRQLQIQNASLDADRLEALRLSQIKTDFLATLSHEIRTPLNGILGMSELLLTMPLPARQREYAAIIHESGRALMPIINDILDYARLEAGSLRVVPGPCDPIPICHDALRLMSARAREKALLLDLIVDAPVGTHCLADPARLREVLLNLLANAIKFTDSGAVILRVAGENGRLRFEVQDTGMGIAPEFQQLLFKPFSRADGTEMSARSGSGLGLAICKQLVEQMNGAIGVYSVAGDGSTFWFDLPMGPREEIPEGGASTAALTPRAPEKLSA